MHPSVFENAKLYFLPSVTGLVEWVDYIPVARAPSVGRLSAYDEDGGVTADQGISSITGLRAWVDYIPVYAVSGRSRPWYVGSSGYIPYRYNESGVEFLFANGEQGAWYDPSDLSTMFQLSNGTTAVTAVEQPVGYIADKSGNGNHAIQATAAARPILRARHNLLTYSEQLDNPAWQKINCAVTPNAAVAPDGALTADLNYPTAVSESNFRQSFSVKNGAKYRVFIYYKDSGAGYAGINQFGNAIAGTASFFDLVSGQIAQAGTSHLDVTMEPVGDGWYRCGVTLTANADGTITLLLGSSISNSFSQPVLGEDQGVYCWGAQLVYGDASKPYQRIAAATDYDSDPAKFPYYLDFDGVDDSMSTGANVDFSATDAVSVFAGMEKYSDAATGELLELSAIRDTNDGSFGIKAPGAAGAVKFGLEVRGTISSQANITAAAFNAPIRVVLTGLVSIPAPSIVLRANGTQAALSVATLGTGNFGSYPFFVGRRASSSLPLNCGIYQLIIRGAMSDATEIAAAEAYVAGKTGVILP